MKAKLVYWHKARIQNRYILEMKLHRVSQSEQYKDGVKYRIILIDSKTKKRVLMDNHYPKGHHIHLDKEELSYTFIDEEKLVEDFKRLVLEHMEVTL